MTNWPMPQDFNEAVQNPAVSFADPDLRDGRTTVGPHGVPLPFSGNYADVYQVRGPDGRDWAVKCFTRPVSGLADRYARVSEALARANLPFGVGFDFLAAGVRVRGAWRPVIKMEWVEGRPLNQAVADNTDRPEVVAALARIWVRLGRRLRAAEVVHGDLQHGNVLLVPGSKPGSFAIKLVDYDGMYLPALANSPSGEAGHPNFQHPARMATGAYGPDLDRFPLLVVFTALKALEVAGPAVWDRYDNGDNLLFTEDDFKNPAASPLLQELWRVGGAEVRSLVARLAVACRRPLADTPWLDDIVSDAGAVAADAAAERAAADLFGPPPSASPVQAPTTHTDLSALSDLRLPDPGLSYLGAPTVEVAYEAVPAYEAAPEYEPESEPEYAAEPEAYSASHATESRSGSRAAERPPPRRPRPEPRRPTVRRRRSSGKPVVPILIVGVMLLLAGGVVAGIVLIATRKSEPAAQVPPPVTFVPPAPNPYEPPPFQSPPRFGPIVPPTDPFGGRPPGFGTVPARPEAAAATIVSHHSGKVLGVGMPPFEGGKQVLTSDPKAGDRRQQWRFVPAVDDWFYLEVVETGTVMSLHRDSTADGAEVVTAAKQRPPSDTQMWKPVAVPNRAGAVKLVNRASGKVMGVDGDRLDSEARLFLGAETGAAKEMFTVTYPGVAPAVGAPATAVNVPNAPKSGWDLFELRRLMVVDDVVRLPRLTSVSTREMITGPFQVGFMARTEADDIRVGGPGISEVVFNDKFRPGMMQARVQGLRGGQKQIPIAPFTPNTWYTLGWRVTGTRMTVWMDDKIVFDEAGEYDLSFPSPIRISAWGSNLEVKSVSVTALK